MLVVFVLFVAILVYVVFLFLPANEAEDKGVQTAEDGFGGVSGSEP